MLHVTCDLCGKEMRPGADHHYVIKIEAFAAHDPSELTEEDLDRDNMEAVGELLRECEENQSPVELTEHCKNFRYDLCPNCHQKFLKDPLAREREAKLFFSKN